MRVFKLVFTAIRWILAPLIWWIGVLFKLLNWIVSKLFGKVSWSPPAWPGYVAKHGANAGTWVKTHPRNTLIGVTAIAALAYGGTEGYRWYHARPKPIEVAIGVVNPPRTRIEDRDAKPNPARINFSHSVAPLNAVGKVATTGITLSPAIDGTWVWDNDRTLVFTPKAEWPVGTDITVSFAKQNLFRPEARFASYNATITTAAFAGKFVSAEFYQDPVDPAGKKVIATVNFTHPVDVQDLEKRITLRDAKQSTGVLGIGGATTKFRVTTDKLKLNAYIHSDPLPIPKDASTLTITVDSGARSTLAGKPLAAKLERSVGVPGLASLAVEEVAPTIVINAKSEPEQVLVLRTSAVTHEQEITKAVNAFVLPVHHPNTKPEDRKQPYAWSSGDIARIGPEILGQSQKLNLDAVPAEREVVDAFNFRYGADPGRYVYVKVAKGLTSFGGYQLGKEHGQVFRVPPFPAEVRIMAQGSLLALSGEKKLSVLARDVPGIRYDIARVLPSHIQQLVGLGYREDTPFGNPEFQGEADESYLTERFTRTVDLPKGKPGKAMYQALDLTQYLDKDGTTGKRGVFLLRVRAYDPAKKRDIGKEDRRLIVVTDLGVLAKRAVDGSHDMFVQSIFTGDPVAGATVEVIGKNGLTVLKETSNDGGHARVNSLKGYDREREPVMFVVKKGNDLSFLPYNRSDRKLDFSRFDIGGVANNLDAGKLSAYLFSDRGIYRPGEDIRIGMIVKSADWAKPTTGLPMEVEITDARGLTVKKDKIKLSAVGFEEVRHTTLDTAPTGTYTVNLYLVKDGKADALVGSTTIKVQEFQPDRLRMTTRFSADAPEGWVSPQDLKARVSLQNLFGTPAENRRITGTLTLSPSLPYFPSFKDYTFVDPQRAKDGVSENLPESKTNDKGEAEFDLNLQRFARATYRAHVLAQGFEADGGRGVSSEAAVLVSNLPYLIGYKTDGDTNFVRKDSARKVDLVAINSSAKKTAAEGLTLHFVERRFVSVLTKQDSGVYKYQSKEKEVAIEQKPFSVAATGTTLALATDKPGSFAYIVRDAQGQEFARIRYNVAGEANLTRSLEKNAELKLTLAKPDYAAGDNIEVQIEAPYSGSGLITIERDKVHTHTWFKTKTTSTVQKIQLPRGLEGNAYLTVTFIRDPGSEEIYTSPLSYGVAPFSISLAQRQVKLDVGTPDLVKPGDKLTFKVKSGAPTRAVVFAVDEGVLQVARYKNPDPLGYFFQKRALEVKTTQILDLILPEFSRVMAAAPGGDAEGALGKFLNPFKRKRDKAVAYWSGVVDVGADGRDLTWTVPDNFNGSLRVIAIAVNADAVGVFQKKTTVRGDFVMTPNLPLSVVPGDEFTVSVGVANSLASSGADAKVALSLATSPHFEVVGESKLELPIPAMRESSAQFRLRAKPVLGSGTLTFVSGIGKNTAKLAQDISVRPASPYMHQLSIGTLTTGDAEVPMTRNLHKEYRTLEASISHLPLGLSHGLAAYLGDYEYSCTEQLVSKGMPALVLSSRPEFGHVTAKPGADLNALIGVLRSRQNAEGGYGLWAANAVVVDPVSVYAQHFLLEAKERGRAVPSDMLSKGNAYLQQLAASEGNNLAEDRARAYATYILTRQGQVTSNYAAAIQKRLEERDAKTWKSDVAAVYLAATYQLLKQDRLAERALSGFELGVKKPAPNDPLAYVYYDAYYDTLIKDAVALTIYAKHFPARLKSLSPDAYNAVVVPLQRGQYTTYSSAQLLLAFDAIANVAGTIEAGKFALHEVLKDGSLRAITLPQGLVPRVNFAADAQKLKFTNNGKLTGFYVVNQSGFDMDAPKTEIKEGLEVIREYTTVDGKPITAVKLGEEIEVHLKFRSLRGAIDNVALVDMLPGGFDLVLNPPDVLGNSNAGQVALRAGCRGREDAQARPSEDEAENQANDNNCVAQPEGEGEGDGEGMNARAWQPPFGSGKGNWMPDYADTREDRVVLYGAAGATIQEFTYRIKATNVGTFVIPPAYAEAMYDRTVKARSASGGKLQVDAASTAAATPAAPKAAAATPAKPAK